MLSNLVPSFLKKRIRKFVIEKYYHKWYSNFLNERKMREDNLPKYNLEQKHIDNLKILLNRQALLKKMPINAVCAEIGVDHGEFLN
jgi:hypothetical protein